MWNPTHVQVIVQRAKDLIIKGKRGTNDAYVVVQLGKERYMTSIKTRCTNPHWYEECDLLFTDKSQNLEVVIYHRSFFGIDEFLGQLCIPLSMFDTCSSPQTKWYILQGRKEKQGSKYRGQIELTVSFIVNEISTIGSSSNLYTKNKKSTKLKQVLSRASHIKIPHLPRRSFSLKTDSLNLSQQIQRLRERRLSEGQQSQFTSDEEMEEKVLKPPPSLQQQNIVESVLTEQELKPIRETSNSVHPESTLPISIPDKSMKRSGHFASVPSESWTRLIVNGSSGMPVANSENSLHDGMKLTSNLSSSDLKAVKKRKKGKLRLFKFYDRRHSVQLPSDIQGSYQSILANSNGWLNDISDTDSDADVFSKEELSVYKKMNRKQLVNLIASQQSLLSKQKNKIQDLENYIDDLLVRVMETSPRILHISYKNSSMEYIR